MKRMMKLVVAVSICSAGDAWAQIAIVNMIPNSDSGESYQDCEPGLTVDPSNRNRLVGTAFTPNIAGSSSTNAPIFVSTDGGATWSLNSIVPTTAGSYIPTWDITMRFAASGTLYGGILHPTDSHLYLLRETDPLLLTLMSPPLLDRNAPDDQPFTQAATVLGGGLSGNDAVFWGDNEFTATNGARINVTQDGRAASVTIAADAIDERGSSDDPPIRPAIHPSGVVYGAYFGGNGTTVVVVRDDNWATAPTPFNALIDPVDSKRGYRVATGINVPYVNSHQASFGQERFVSSDMTIAVHPLDPSIVYVAWGDQPAGTTGITLHVRRGTASGTAWSGDLPLAGLGNAKNPALAINSHGRIAFLYQKLNTVAGVQHWETHLQRSDDGTTWSDVKLADTLAASPTADINIGPYLGDYDYVLGVGRNFYGIFSASNYPDTANFPGASPLPVVYQRNVNFATHQLLPFTGGGTVPVSIDPFFFKTTEKSDDTDFFVRDWTDNATATGHDDGMEPSTHGVFYTTSDVWNGHDAAPAPFNANDQPAHVDPQLAALGNNYAFTRISRASGSTAQDVTAHFLFADFGLGVPYQDLAAAPDPPLHFNVGETTKVTPGYQWELPPTVSDHVCMAVQIDSTTANDHILSPSLIGLSPGWPTTDLLVINDNNKAQRNMSVLRTGAGSAVAGYAILHNAAPFPRDLQVIVRPPPNAPALTRGARVQIIGGREHIDQPLQPGQVLTITGMQPGENRWIGLALTVPQGKVGTLLPVTIDELVGGQVVNGIAIAPRISPVSDVITDDLREHAQVLARAYKMGAKIAGLADAAAVTAKLLRRPTIPDDAYLGLVKAQLSLIKQLAAELAGAADLFGAKSAVAALAAAKDVVSVAAAHAALLARLDATLTMTRKAGGDAADILQTIIWEQTLYTTQPTLAKLPSAAKLVQLSREFRTAYGARKEDNRDYPQFIDRVMPALKETAKAPAFEALRLDQDLADIERSRASLPALQKAHRGFLLKLQSVARTQPPGPDGRR